MAQAQQRQKTSQSCHVKQDPGDGIEHNGNHNTIRIGHVVCVTSVPSILCASERTVRDFFAEYGMLLSVTIHHNFLDMEPDGFIYLEYTEKEAAERAIAAVKEKRVGFATCTDTKLKTLVHPSEIMGMKAAMAIARGKPTFEVNEEIRDILLGRHELNRFTQSQQDRGDDDDFILQNLSQHSFATSQSKMKKKRRHNQDGSSGAARPKKAKRIRFTKVVVSNK
ncbi:unnamed protein product [Peronospora belbahrii]|uniref:RRM domain-containing protein n=1 Tax=Peronospora belbahrii TaxID=622444 RepID=A0AAU9LC32_9STRA|nr:unnamed protein product [Peronospora belbahrii]